MARIVVIRDGIEWAMLPAQGRTVDVGSASENAICLPADGVRPFHLVLRCRRMGWFVVPRGGPIETSRGVVESSARLGPGDWVAAGPYRLSVREIGAAGTPAPVRDRTLPALDRPPARIPPLALRWVSGEALLRHPVAAGETILGRGDSCDVVLDDGTVSERHARITAEPSAVLVEDLASLNGTFLDGRRVHLAEVGPGATLRLGRVEVECVPDRDDADGQADAPEPARVLCTEGLREAFEAIRRAAAVRQPVLILGETGTGKDVLARMLHTQGPRRAEAFVPINCAALPAELAEAILFGHQRGAFTGAVETRRGAFQRADRGTLFLDEIGEAPPGIQVKLLRALEDREILPVGAESAVRVDVRLVAATHRDLAGDSRSGRFRWDLYHRLAVVVVRIPPLRERPQDILPMAEMLLGSIAAEVGPRRLTGRALRRLRAHSWPGNVRELRNVLFRAALATEGPDIGSEAIALEATADDMPVRRYPPPASLQEAVEAHGGNMAAAARSLGMPRSTLRDRIAGRRGERSA